MACQVLGGVRTHELWVAFALPPLVALVAAGVFARRRLLWPSAAALGLGVAALIRSRRRGNPGPWT